MYGQMPHRPQTAQLGKFLRAYRKNAGLTQAQIARRIEISASHYSLLESGQKAPSAKTLAHIASVLALDPLTTEQLLSLLANARGLNGEDALLSDNVQALLVEIRHAAKCLPSHYVIALRREIHELAK